MFWLLISASVVSAPQDALAYTATVTVSVDEPRQTADALVKLTNKIGGYFARRNQNSLVLKVPRSSMPKVISAAIKAGTVLSRNEQARDLSKELLQKRTLLKSRESMLEKYFAVLHNADYQAVLQVEREITNLVQEIETYKGRLKRLEHELYYAQITVSFKFKERRAPRRDGTSSFAWLNTVNLADTLGAYQ